MLIDSLPVKRGPLANVVGVQGQQGRQTTKVAAQLYWLSYHGAVEAGCEDVTWLYKRECVCVCAGLISPSLTGINLLGRSYTGQLLERVAEPEYGY